jgi:hypothetical protein
MKRAFVPVSGTECESTVSQQELLGFLETAEHMLVDPATVLTEATRGTLGCSKQVGSVRLLRTD